MSKRKRPKRRSKFKIPSKHRSKKHDEASPIFYEDLDNKSFNRLKTLDSFYFAVIRNFYNSLVPKNQRVSDDTKFIRITRSVNDPEILSMTTCAKDILFSFLGTFNDIPPKISIGKLIEFTGDTIHNLPDSEDRFLLKLLKDGLRAEGYTPFKKKVLCIIEEVPTESFIDRDEIDIDMDNPEFRLWAGEFAPDIVEYLKKYLGVSCLKVKIINKYNNPKAYKHYLKLKQVMGKIEEI